MTSVPRPDELQRESEIRKSQGRTSDVRSGLQTAATFGAAGAIPKVAAKIQPFLSQYIPAGLALKGINKVMPAVGKFLKNGIAQGLSLESGLSFLKDNLGRQESNEPAKQSRSILKQYDPELHKFIELGMKKGMSLLEVGKKALEHGRFKKSIDKLTKDHKTSWDSILRTVFGEGAAYEEPAEEQQLQQQQPNQVGQPGAGQQPGGKWDQIQRSLQEMFNSQ